MPHKFYNLKKEGNIGKLDFYGPIASESWWGDEVTPKQFQDDLEALGEIDRLEIFINSPGGDVFAGQAIHSMIKRLSCEVVVYIDGLAASIASVIAMAADKVIMPKNAMMMIHKAWTWTYGNANDFRKLADDLDKIDKSILAAYTEKVNGKISEDEINNLVNNETWLTAEECVEKGFADELEDTKKVAACIDDKLFSNYKHVPKALAKAKEENPTNDVALAKAKLQLTMSMEVTNA